MAAGIAKLAMDAKCLPPQPQEPEPSRDNFDGKELRMYWNFLRNPHAADWSLAERLGWLRLKGSAVTLNDLDFPAFVDRRQQKA